jgi:hypothetical protein
METVQRLLSFLLVIFAGFCVIIWGVWYNPNFDEFITLPIAATDFPGDPMYGPLIFAFGAFIVAYFVYPSENDDD